MPDVGLDTDLEELQPRQEVSDVTAQRLQRRIGLAAPHAGDLAGHTAGEDLLQLCRHHHQTCRPRSATVRVLLNTLRPQSSAGHADASSGGRKRLRK